MHLKKFSHIAATMLLILKWSCMRNTEINKTEIETD